MTEETKTRLQERFKQLLDETDHYQNPRPRTIWEIEEMTLQLREQLTQATLEEISREAQLSEAQQSETNDENPEETASKCCCPQCHRTAWFKGNRSRHLVTRTGTLSLTRRYFYCRRCRQGFCPLDRRLGLPSESDFTPQVVQEVAYLCAVLPFEQAVQTLARFTGVRVSARSAERLCLTLAESQASAFRETRDARTLPQAFAFPTPPSSQPLYPSAPAPAPAPAPAVLYVEADGIQTPMRGGQWREMKIGVVRSLQGDGREDQPSRYVNHLGEAKHFGSHLESLAIDCGSLTAKCLVFLGDGAPWLWNLAQTRFPRAIQILDFWHALEYIGSVAREAFPDPKQEADRKAWLAAQATEMKKSGFAAVHAALEGVREVAPESVESAVRYFTNNVSRMDYALYLKQGLCIGSGLAESSCKRLVTQRLKNSGMHWSERGAQIICALRCLLLGGEWESFIQFWNRQVQTKMQPISPLT